MPVSRVSSRAPSSQARRSAAELAVVLAGAHRVEQHEAPARDVERSAAPAAGRAARSRRPAGPRGARSGRGCRGRRARGDRAWRSTRAPRANCSVRPRSAMSPLMTVKSTRGGVDLRHGVVVHELPVGHVAVGLAHRGPVGVIAAPLHLLVQHRRRSAARRSGGRSAWRSSPTSRARRRRVRLEVLREEGRALGGLGALRLDGDPVARARGEPLDAHAGACPPAPRRRRAARRPRAPAPGRRRGPRRPRRGS